MASQVPKRKECDLDSLAPVNAVNFYNVDVRQALAMPAVPSSQSRAPQRVPPVPVPEVAAKQQPLPPVNPYAAAVSAPMSSARRPFGLSANSNHTSHPVERKQPTYTIVENPPVKAAKKVKTVEASPYAASPSLAGVYRGHMSGFILTPCHSKWLFQKALYHESIQDTFRDVSACAGSANRCETCAESSDSKLYVLCLVPVSMRL